MGGVLKESELLSGCTTAVLERAGDIRADAVRDDDACAELLPDMAESTRLGTLAAGDADLLVAPDGQTFAWRGENQRLVTRLEG